ncbi:MAG: hypothetical protein CMO61_13370 [Verrucomicrobiales bacterium]|nr:hypothetical protein [Verrucomicrobiales bacterium]
MHAYDGRRLYFGSTDTRWAQVKAEMANFFENENRLWIYLPRESIQPRLLTRLPQNNRSLYD